MNEKWIKKGDYIYKETEAEYKVVSCMIWCNSKDGEIYLPAIHSINKSDFPKSKINEIIKNTFPQHEEIDFCKSIVLLSPFIGTCEDIVDKNDNRVSFKKDDSDSTDYVINKLLSIAEDLNL